MLSRLPLGRWPSGAMEHSILFVSGHQSAVRLSPAGIELGPGRGAAVTTWSCSRRSHHAPRKQPYSACLKPTLSPFRGTGRRCLRRPYERTSAPLCNADVVLVGER